MIKMLLQELLDSNVEAMDILYKQFINAYPNDFGIHQLLKQYIFSESECDIKLIDDLETALKQKIK